MLVARASAAPKNSWPRRYRNFFVTVLTILAAAFTAVISAHAQMPPGTAVIGSVSGQFLVSARRPSISPRSLQLATGPDMITLQPALATVSCERIKQELLRELGMRDDWHGKIFVVIVPAESADDPVAVAPERFAGNWNCGIQLPDVIDRERFVEAVVRACLTEIGNRNSRGRFAQMPEWLVQGFTGQLLGFSTEQFVLVPPQPGLDGFSVTRLGVDLTDNPRISGPNVRRINRLAEAIDVMHTNLPLTFDQLSWPTDEQLMGNERTAYRSSSQLFVNELLRVRNGPACMSTMLAELPNYLNWQLAFLDAFRNHFNETLDVEKWWALQLASYTGRDLLHLWTPEESWKQLAGFFQIPIDVKIGPAPAMRTEIAFQTVIRGWSRTRQLQLLKQKLWDLELLRAHVTLDYIPLVEDYRLALEHYYQKRISGARNVPRYGPLLDKLENETIRTLDELDARREKLRPEPQMPAAPVVESADASTH
jgi:hypothetical protein